MKYFFLLLASLWLAGCGCVAMVYPPMTVTLAEIEGQAELAQANFNRQIKVREAEAEKESAALKAESEVLRAEGVAKANQIIGESLKGHESYLKYLWIQTLHEKGNEVIYVPTENNFPLMEAGRAVK